MTRNAKVQIAGRLSYRAAIEAELQLVPQPSLKEVRRRTGASQAMVSHVYGQLVAAGRLSLPPHMAVRV